MRYEKTFTDESAVNIMTGGGKNATTLTPAETRVIALVSRAKTNKEIAVALGISPATVKRHMENILNKLQLKNRVEAAIYAMRSVGCLRGRSPDCPLEMGRDEISLNG